MGNWQGKILARNFFYSKMLGNCKNVIRNYFTSSNVQLNWLSTQVQSSFLSSCTWKGEGGELWTWVESQFIWTSSELFELDTALPKSSNPIDRF